VSKPTELGPDSKQLPSKKPAKSMQDINLKAGPYFGMTVPPVAERREHLRSESTYQWLTSAVFEAK